MPVIKGLPESAEVAREIAEAVGFWTKLDAAGLILEVRNRTTFDFGSSDRSPVGHIKHVQGFMWGLVGGGFAGSFAEDPSGLVLPASSTVVTRFNASGSLKGQNAFLGWPFRIEGSNSAIFIWWNVPGVEKRKVRFEHFEWAAITVCGDAMRIFSGSSDAEQRKDAIMEELFRRRKPLVIGEWMQMEDICNPGFFVKGRMDVRRNNWIHLIVNISIR
jgi:hypothetical protein